LAKERKCPTFSGEHGIEALLYVEEQFRKLAACTLSWTTGPELMDTALSNWEDIIAPIADVDKTPARFKSRSKKCTVSMLVLRPWAFSSNNSIPSRSLSKPVLWII
jgi:hypothetical protein